MDWILSLNWHWFLIRLAGFVVITPIAGFLMIRLLEDFEKAWKTKEKRKRWLACCIIFAVIIVTSGWFR